MSLFKLGWDFVIYSNRFMRKGKNSLLDLSLKPYQIERASTLKFSTKRNQKFYGAKLSEHVFWEKSKKNFNMLAFSS